MYTYIYIYRERESMRPLQDLGVRECLRRRGRRPTREAAPLDGLAHLPV